MSFKFIEFIELSTLTITMELTEYLFVNFMVLTITMTSCINSEVYIFCIHGKRLIFIFIAIVEKQLCELYISYTKRHNNKYFGYLRYLHFGSRYCGQSLVFSGGTDGFNHYDLRYLITQHNKKKTQQCIQYCVFDLILIWFF